MSMKSELIQSNVELMDGHHDTLVTVNQKGNSTVVFWGRPSTPGSIPVPESSALVEDYVDVKCLDAVWILKERIIIVNCVKKLSDSLRNIYFYVNST